MDLELEAIIDGCLKNRRKSQNELYRLYYAYGMSVSIRYVKSETDAIEILNDSFMKVFNNLRKFDRKQNFKPWFRKIVVNTALNHMKKTAKLKLNTEIDPDIQLATREDILSRIGYKDLIKLVQSLSTAYRTVFNMYVIDGFKHEEIANSLGITVGTSKSNLSKARAILQGKVIKQ